jgi:hypothetical protein
VTLGELERSGALTILSREVTPRAGDLLFRTLGRDPVVATGTPDDDRGVAQVVEIDPARLDPHFVALFVRADAHSVPVANTHGALSRDDLRRCRIPRLPLRDPTGVRRRVPAARRHEGRAARPGHRGRARAGPETSTASSSAPWIPPLSHRAGPSVPPAPDLDLPYPDDEKSTK